MPRDFVIRCGEYSIECTPSGLPGLYDELKARAALAEEIALDERSPCCLTVRRGDEPWPFLTVAIGCSAAAAGGSPAALLVPETATLFIGYGERLLAIRLLPCARLWVAEAPGGFGSWEQHGEVVLLAARASVTAYSTTGEELWTCTPAPPWSHAVRGDSIEVTDGAGRRQRFPLRGSADGSNGPGSA